MIGHKFYDHQGNSVIIGERIGSGGEGDVFEQRGTSGTVAKVYHPDRLPDVEKAEKLKLLADGLTSELLKVAAWPLNTLHDRPGGAVVGISMPMLSGYKEIHNLYSPAGRKIDFPKADWRFLIHVAANCAAAFETIHQNDYVIGDVNEGNLLASNDAMVRIIDCDSFQVQANGRCFKCEVGVAFYTPPELQGKAFRDIVRNRNHDLFGLAVLIFHILMMGRHPYSGRFTGVGEMSLERAILEHRFAYGHSARLNQMMSPPDAPALEYLPSSLSELFNRAFSPRSISQAKRPDAKEWWAALKKLERNLKTCSTDRAHKFSSHLTKCPWCELMTRGAPNFFISVSFQLTTSATRFDLDLTWRRIEQTVEPLRRFLLNAVQFQKPLIVNYLPLEETAREELERELATLIDANQSLRSFSNLVAIPAGLGVVLTILGILVPFAAMFGIPILFVFAIWWTILHYTSSFYREKRTIKAKIQKLEHDRLSRILNSEDFYQRALKDADHQRLKALSELEVKIKELDQAKIRYKDLSREFQQELQEIQKFAERKQREEFLDRQLIWSADVPGIGDVRKQTLASYGIETALDIDESRLISIPGFGGEGIIAGYLIAWRRSLESRFKFDKAKGVPATEVSKLQMKYAQIRHKLEGELDNGSRNIVFIRQKFEKQIEKIKKSMIS